MRRHKFYHGCNILINQIAKKGSINHLSTYKLFINLPKWCVCVQGNQVGGVIGCQVSKFPNSCIASSLLQEELLFCACKEIATADLCMMKTMLISTLDSGNLE